jgi:hypothetical protein
MNNVIGHFSAYNGWHYSRPWVCRMASDESHDFSARVGIYTAMKAILSFSILLRVRSTVTGRKITRGIIPRFAMQFGMVRNSCAVIDWAGLSAKRRMRYNYRR